MWVVIAVFVGLVSLWLLTQKWAWTIALVVGGIASTFSCLASIIHFQILAAVGFFFLSGFIGLILTAMYSDS